MILGYVVTFGFGAWQLTQDPGSMFHEDFRDVFIVFFAVIFGALVAGQSQTFAPDYGTAKLSANRIFYLLDRYPEIDGYSEGGFILVSLRQRNRGILVTTSHLVPGESFWTVGIQRCQVQLPKSS